MARRSAVDDVPSTLDEPWDTPRQPAKKGWGGGGGRWFVWLGRALLWTFVVVVVVNGIRAPFERFTAEPVRPGTVATPGGPAFPVSGASAFALQFGDVYLNYDQATAADRQAQLARFLPEGVDTQFGWNGLGQFSARSVQVSGVDVQDAENGIVNLVAKAGDRWVQLAVPVYAKDGRYVVSGLPALLQVPEKAQLPEPPGIDHDTDLEAQLQTQLVGFFQAYAASDTVNLQRFAEGGITGLGSSVVFGQLTDVNAPKGASDERTVVATVQWKVPQTQSRGSESLVVSVYELVVVKKSDQWNVRSIRGAVRTGS